MISVVIPTHESERLLAHTLAALVPGALDGVLREVIVADAGSTDGTAKVADVAGCRFLVIAGERGARLADAAATARAGWLWFVQPGSIPGSNWIEELGRFIRESDLLADDEAQAGTQQDHQRHNLPKEGNRRVEVARHRRVEGGRGEEIE